MSGFFTPSAGQVIRATHVSQFSLWLAGAKLDAPATVAATSTTDYTLTVRSQDGATGLALDVLYGGASSPSTIASFNKGHIKFVVTTVWMQMASPASGPGVGMTSFYPKTDGTLAYKVGTSSTENVIATTGGFTNPMSASGDIIIGGTTGAATRLAVGTSNWMLQAVGSSITWAASLQSLMVSQADIVYATTANVPARLAKGTAFQELVVNAAATGVTWASGALAVVQTTGDLIYGTATNAVARLVRGLPYQSLNMDGAGTTPNWGYCSIGLASAPGDLIYAGGANVLSRLTIGSAFQELAVNAAGTAPAWASGPLRLASAAGDLIYANGANSLVRLPIGTNNFNLQVAGAALTYAASLMSLLTATGDIIIATSANTPARLAVGTSGTVLHGGSTPSYSKVTAADVVTGAVMVKIAEVTGTGTTGVMEFSSISSAFRALEIHVFGRATGTGGPVGLRLSFETTATSGAYDAQTVRGNGTAVTAFENTGGSDFIGIGSLVGTGSPAAAASLAIIKIPEYANTTYHKNIYANGNGLNQTYTSGAMFNDSVMGWWESTAAISFVRLALSAGSFEAGARMTLYGLPV